VADALSLLTNIVMAWNTAQMQAVIDRWNTRRRQQVPHKLIGRIAPTALRASTSGVSSDSQRAVYWPNPTLSEGRKTGGWRSMIDPLSTRPLGVPKWRQKRPINKSFRTLPQRFACRRRGRCVGIAYSTRRVPDVSKTRNSRPRTSLEGSHAALSCGIWSGQTRTWSPTLATGS
jgi:hypothetical protein